MELNEMMDKELKRRFEDLENLKTGSDEQGKATDNIVKLYKLRMDENESNVNKEADEDKLELEKHKLELEIAKADAPAVILGTLSLGCMVGSNHILQKRNAALTAAYVTLDKAFNEYKGRVSERFGERVQHEIEHGVKAVEVESKVVNEDGTEEVVKSYIDETDGVHSPYDLLFDEMVDTWEPDAQINKNFLSMVQTHASNQLRTRGYLFLNEVYRMIGKYNNGQQIYNPQGQIVGWLYDPNNESLSNCVKFGLDKMQGDRSVVLHFNVDGPIIDKI